MSSLTTTFVDSPSTTTPIDAAYLNAVSKGLRVATNAYVTTPEEYGAVGDGTTDDTAAINAAINACVTAGGGTVRFGAKTYLCNGALDTSRGGNAVIALPTGPAPVTLLGVAPPNQCYPGTDAGRYTILKTTKTGLTRSGTAGVPSLIGGPTNSSWAETMTSVINICLWLPANPTIAGVDLWHVRRCLVDGLSVIAQNVGDTDYTLPTSVYAFALRTPDVQNYNAVLIRNGQAHGTYAGLVGSVESLTLGYWVSKWCVVGWAPMPGGHGGAVLKMSTEWCKYHVSGWSETGGAGSVATGPNGETSAQVSVTELAIEDHTGGAWYDTTYHVNDSTNRIKGVAYFDRYDGTAPSSAITLNGATNLKTIPLLAAAGSFGGASGGGAALTVQDENANVSTAVTQIDFQGAGVSAALGSGGEVVVTIPGSTGGTTTVANKELLMQDGVTGPPVPLETEARDDWLYQD